MRIKNIIPASLQKEFMKERLEQKKTSALIEEEVLSFDVFKAQCFQEDQPESVRFLTASKRIRERADELSDYRSMVRYPSFIMEVLNFSAQLAKAQVSLDELPNEHELTRILRWVDDLSLLRENERQFDSWLQSASFEHIRIMDAAKDIFDKRQLDAMIKHGASYLPLRQVKPEVVRFKKALNPRQECEAMIQDLLNRGLSLSDCIVVVADMQNTLPVLKQVAARYRVALQTPSSEEPSKVAELFSAGIRLWLNQDIEHLLKAIKKEVFDVPISASLNRYTQLFVQDVRGFLQPFVHVAAALEDKGIINQKERQKLLDLENEAEAQRQGLEEGIGRLLQCEKPLDVLSVLYEFCRQKEMLRDVSELNVFCSIKEDIEACFTILADDASLNDFLFLVQRKKRTVKAAEDGLIVTDIEHPFHAKKVGYVLGLSQDNYPGFKPLQGLFDEAFVSGTGYPDLAARLDFHNRKVDWIKGCGEDLTLSYCCSSYEGKSKEASYAIEQFAKTKPSFWELVQNERQKSRPVHKLSEETAKRLFVNKGRIQGSISSFERYFYCPYSYFLESGLRLADNKIADADAAWIGTIQHSVLEELLTKDKKKYADLSKESLEQMVEERIEPLKRLYIKKRAQLQSVSRRMADGLYIALEFLRDMEQNTSFVCTDQEYRFEMDLLADSSCPIKLRGIIDRIDCCQGVFRILDYKSSVKTLSQTKVLAGIQLQLLTYLIVAARLLGKAPAGAYYFSLKNPTVELSASKLNGRSFELEPIDEDAMKSSWFKEESLKGWTFDAFDTLDYDARHVSGLSIKDAKVSIRGGEYDFDKVQKVVEELYSLLQKELLSGDIRCTPLEGACMFCDKRPICRFSGQLKKAEARVEGELKKADRKSEGED